MKRLFFIFILAKFSIVSFAQSLSSYYDLDTASFQTTRILIESDTRLLKITPDNDELYFKRAQKYAKIGNYNKALADYNTADSIHPNFWPILYMRGATKHRLEDLEGAYADFNRVTILKPDNEWGHADKALILKVLKRYNEALKACDEALKIKPNWGVPYLHKGDIYKMMNQYDNALINYNKSILLDSTNAMALNNRGNTKKEMNSIDAAIVDFKKAIDLKPDYILAYYNLSECYLLQKNEGLFLQYINKTLEISPNYYDALLTRKEYYKSKGLKIKACEDFLLLKKINPTEKDIDLFCH